LWALVRYISAEANIIREISTNQKHNVQ